MEKTEKSHSVDYRCKLCRDIVPCGTHHKMEQCLCGAVMVDRGWYGSRVLWSGGRYDEVVEVVPADAD